MRVAQLKAREALDDILAATLSRGWSEQFGQTISVTPGPARGQQVWHLQPLLSACFVSGMRRDARRFLADSFRHTRVRHRVIPQWLLGTALATSPGLRTTSRPLFSVWPAVPKATALLVIPTNQRIRIFDFAQRTSRVFLKEGFDSTTMVQEIAVRGPGLSGPFVPMTKVGQGSKWFEEGLVDAWTLSRCPRWVDHTAAEQQAMAALDRWSDASVQVRDSDEVVPQRVESLQHHLAVVRSRFPGATAGLEQPIRWLVQVAQRVPQYEMARTHGDLQGGNVLIRKQDRRVFVIDWEHSAIRSRDYDRFVYGLRTRSGSALGRRLVAAWAGNAAPKWLGHLAADKARLRANLALFVLEDLDWFAKESTTGPYTCASAGLLSYRHALREFFGAVGTSG